MKSIILFYVIIINVVVNANDMGIHIIGGHVVKSTNEDFKFITSLQSKSYGNKYKHYCGGSLIHPSFIITAAHCVKYGRKPDRVRIGSYNIDHGGVLRSVKKVIQYPNYYSIYRNDIAILELNKPVTTIKPVNIDVGDQHGNTNDVITSLGWGYTSEGSGIVTKDLRMVDLDVLDLKQCKKTYFSVGQWNVCTWGTWNKKTKQRNDQCSGDSGGPSLYYNKDTHETQLVALTSYGKGCGRVNAGGVNTRVAYYYDFLKKYNKNIIPIPTQYPTSRPTRRPGWRRRRRRKRKKVNNNNNT